MIIGIITPPIAQISGKIILLKFDNSQIENILKVWLDKTYEIKGVTPINRIDIKL